MRNQRKVSQKVKVIRVPRAHHRPFGAHPLISSEDACGNMGFHPSVVTFGKPHLSLSLSLHLCKTRELDQFRVSGSMVTHKVTSGEK